MEGGNDDSVGGVSRATGPFWSFFPHMARVFNPFSYSSEKLEGSWFPSRAALRSVARAGNFSHIDTRSHRGNRRNLEPEDLPGGRIGRLVSQYQNRSGLHDRCSEAAIVLFSVGPLGFGRSAVQEAVQGEYLPFARDVLRCRALPMLMLRM